MNFRDSLDFCGLIDLDYHGVDYTWSGRRAGGQTIWCRLDRFCANNEWISLFNEYYIFHKAMPFSDHHALVLKLQPDKPSRRKKKFRFEFMWIRNGNCTDIVEKAWKEMPVSVKDLQNGLPRSLQP